MKHTETIKHKDENRNMTFVATVELRHLSGNSHPHFSVTGEDRNSRGRVYTCGCLHDQILKFFPHLADAVALHLCDDSGIPLYALENGFYYCENPNEYSDSVISEHFRIPLEMVPSIRKMTKAELGAWIETQKPRWKAEADAVISKYALTVEHV